MNIKKMNTKFFALRDKQNLVLKKLNGEDAVIPGGKFKGRVGVIESAHFFDEHGAMALIRPYNLDKGHEGEYLLNDHKDARTFWRLEGVKIKERKTILCFQGEEHELK